MSAPLPDAPTSSRFEILSRLGEGNMGVVYAAFDRERRARVAVKTLRDVDGALLGRFKREFRALQDLAHPNLCALGELYEDGGSWFFTMELIEGPHFLDFVRRADGKVDEARLRAALPQLVRGLHALHAAGKVHRDVKPSNVLVDGGRVVLLDFGLVTEADRQLSIHAGLVGTAAYMAPEQATRDPIGPAADWYSVGVILFEALTGQLPFEGMPLELIARKQTEDAPRPSSVAEGVPPDLEALCVALLARDPAARPTGEVVLGRLGATAEAAPTQAAQPDLFVGRRKELATLRQAHAAVRAGHPVTVVVSGEPGVGKSALARAFARDLVQREPTTLVLSVRCFEREAARHKVADGLVEALAHHLLRRSDAEVAALLPVKVGLLTRYFPVLLRVPQVARAPLVESYVRDPHELRSRVVAVLRELLVRLADERPVLLVVDDLQWADADSLALLTGLLGGAGAPSLMMVGTHRTSGDRERTGQLLPLAGDVRALPLAPLPAEETLDLASTLLGPKGAHGGAEALVRESGGLPLLVHELARWAATTQAGPVVAGFRTGRLEDLLGERLAALAPSERRLLEIVATAGAPLPQATAFQAAQLPGDEEARALNSLRYANLVRTAGARAGDAVEPLSDRISAAVLAHLSDDERRARHRELAAALEISGGGDDERAVHWMAAGERGRAADAARRAAERAASALAFERAARFYRLALEADGPDSPEAGAVQRALGEALANAGRGREAADAFLAAAALARGSDAVGLRRRAADQLLRSGHLDDGMALVKEVLAAVGVPWTGSVNAAFAGLVWRRARLRLRGMGYKEREAGSLPPETLTRIDACWSLAIGLQLVDFVRSADFQARQTMLALSAGEPYRAARALLSEANGLALADVKNHPRARRCLVAGTAAAERAGHPHALGLVPMAEGSLAFVAGQWREACRRFDRAAGLFQERCVDVGRELANTRLFSLWSLSIMGELNEARARHAIMVRDAEEMNDRLSEVMLKVGLLIGMWLSDDRPAEGRRASADALSRWSHAGFQTPHGLDFYSAVQVELYDGRVGDARRLVLTRWPPLAESRLFYAQSFRVFMYFTRAVANLGLAADPAAVAAAGLSAASLVAEIRRDARTMSREGIAWASALAKALGALATWTEGKKEAAIAEMRLAIAALEASEYGLFAWCCRRRLGEWIGGGEGDKLIAEADALLTEQGVKRPARFAWAYAPGGPPV